MTSRASLRMEKRSPMAFTTSPVANVSSYDVNNTSSVAVNVDLTPMSILPLKLPERSKRQSLFGTKKVSKETEQEREEADKMVKDQHQELEALADKYNVLLKNFGLLNQETMELKTRFSDSLHREAELDRKLNQSQQKLKATKEDNVSGDDRLVRAQKRIQALEEAIEQERHDREQVEAVRRGLEKQLRERMRNDLAVVPPSSPNLRQAYGITVPVSNPSMPTFQNLDQEIRQLKDQLIHEEGQVKKINQRKERIGKTTNYC